MGVTVWMWADGVVFMYGEKSEHLFHIFFSYLRVVTMCLQLLDIKADKK